MYHVEILGPLMYIYIYKKGQIVVEPSKFMISTSQSPSNHTEEANWYKEHATMIQTFLDYFRLIVCTAIHITNGQLYTAQNKLYIAYQ